MRFHFIKNVGLVLSLRMGLKGSLKIYMATLKVMFFITIFLES